MASPYHHLYHFPEDLVWEILTWVPVKSLMRFKCVSRSWLSIIMNPSFTSSYRGGRHGLLVPMADPYYRLFKEWYFFLVNLEGPSTQVVYRRIIGNYDYGGGGGGGVKMVGFGGLVNGLMCFYHRNYSYLHNLATRETIQLPLSNNDSQTCSYHFGFDPINKLYKLLKICPVYDDDYEDDNPSDYHNADFVHHLNCEVLTINGVDSSWRIIDAPPPFAIEYRSVCLGGAGLLCWLLVSYSPHFERHLIAFDVVKEKFQVIPLPGPIKFWGCFNLPNYGPSLVLFRGAFLSSENKFELFKVGGWSEGKWGDEQKLTIQTIQTPRGWVNLRGVLPNGKLVIFDYDNPNSIYLFDQSKSCVLEKKFVITLAHADDDDDPCLYLDESLYFEENIIPLSCLFTSAITTHP